MKTKRVSIRKVRQLSKIFALVVLLVVSFVTQKMTSSVPNPLPSNNIKTSEIAHVSRVLDGDTIELSDGRKVRYIGIDAPELHDTDSSKTCFSNEAFIANKNLVENKDVTLTLDTSNTDRYGRLLRYVYVNTTDVGEDLVRNGFARAKDYPPDSAHKTSLKESELFAKEKNVGLWRQCNETM